MADFDLLSFEDTKAVPKVRAFEMERLATEDKPTPPLPSSPPQPKSLMCSVFRRRRPLQSLRL